MFAARTEWRLTLNRLSEHLEERRRLGRDTLDLAESNPTRCGFSLDAQAVLGALADPGSLAYEPDPRGLLRAREAVAKYYAERGPDVSPHQIFLTTSTSEAYSHLFRLLANPGEAILAPRPSYPLFDFLARLNDVELLHYPLVYDTLGEGWRIDFHDLETATARQPLPARAILAVHPNNPTGSYVHPEDLDSLVERCRRNSLALITDEVFADYGLAPASASRPRHASHAGVSTALTFTLSGLSKISALPQMKLAWIVVNGPAEALSAAMSRLEIIADTYLSVSAPLQHALPQLLAMRHNIQPQILARLRSNLAWLDAQLSPHSPVTRLPVQGGWYAVLRLPSVRSDEDWAIEFLTRDGVLVHPGHFYDFLSEGHLVLSLLPEPEVFTEGVGRVLARIETGL